MPMPNVKSKPFFNLLIKFYVISAKYKGTTYMYRNKLSSEKGRRCFLKLVFQRHFYLIYPPLLLLFYRE